MLETVPEGLRSDLFYTSRQLAELLGVSPRTLEGWRRIRTGPKYLAVSHRMVRYRGADVQAWLATFDPEVSEKTAA
jgi:predicted DNA-binding transcriptional regulator AlpA